MSADTGLPGSAPAAREDSDAGGEELLAGPQQRETEREEGGLCGPGDYSGGLLRAHH